MDTDTHTYTQSHYFRGRTITAELVDYLHRPNEALCSVPALNKLEWGWGYIPVIQEPRR